MMNNNDAPLVDGLVIVAANIRHPDVRERFWHHLGEIPGERVSSAIYEFNIADWDDGLWNEEVQWISDLMEESGGTILIWKFDDGHYTRFSIGSER